MDSLDILDTSKLCLKGSFDEQVDKLLKQIRLTRMEVDSLVQLFNDLLMVLRQVWPGCQVTPFGSIVTGLGIKTSDVDVHVNTNSIWHPVDCVKKARNLLHRYPHIFSELFAITTAKVPIVKFLHIPVNCYCDVNFSSCAGVRNSNLIACLLQSDIRALNLAILVKYWSKVHKLTGTNLLPNYALTLLVIFYLQQRLILPSVYYLQKNIQPYIVNHWNTAFNVTALQETTNTESLYELLGGFFKFYANFDFENNIVSTFLGEAINKNVFSNLNTIPVQYDRYKNNVRTNIYNPLRLDTKMCVQDPFEHCRNCTVMIFTKLHTQLVNYIKFANNAYCDQDSRTFLRKILVDNVKEVCTENTKPKVKHIFNNKVSKNNQKLKLNKNRFDGAMKLWRNQTNKT